MRKYAGEFVVLSGKNLPYIYNALLKDRNKLPPFGIVPCFFLLCTYN